MITRLYATLLLMVFFSVTNGQDFSGQWKGEFSDKSSSAGSIDGDKAEYVLDLECRNSKVTGYSYTYFSDEGKRFYTICRVTGFLDKSKNYVEVREVERTKTNVPATIRNCFQVHKLVYIKVADSEELEGNWISAPDQGSGCGFGLTALYRRNLKSSFPNFKNSTASKMPRRNTGNPASISTAKKIVKAPLVNATAKTTVPKPPVAKPIETTTALMFTPRIDSFVKEEPIVKIIQPKINVRTLPRRNERLLQTIQVDNRVIRVDLYDNGEVDGDSISLFYNNEMLLSKKRLSGTAITLDITVDNNDAENELVMYAENLGTIPPNTALMVVTDGSKRYEVRITSDLQKSGKIRFIHRKP